MTVDDDLAKIRAAKAKLAKREKLLLEKKGKKNRAIDRDGKILGGAFIKYLLEVQDNNTRLFNDVMARLNEKDQARFKQAVDHWGITIVDKTEQKQPSEPQQQQEQQQKKDPTPA